MKYKVPKEVEKVPIVASMPIGSVVVGILSVLMAVVSLNKPVFVPIMFIGIGAFYIGFQQAYPREGQMLEVLRYHINPKIIRFNKPIDRLVRHDRKD